MRFSDNTGKLEIRRMLRENREKKTFRRSLLEAGSGLLITVAILGTPLCSYQNREKVKADEVRKMAQGNHGEKEIRVSKVEEVCVVGCKARDGPFHWKKEAYEVDASGENLYRKEFYDIYGVPIMEGIGDDTERFFINRSWGGKTMLVQVIKVGNGKWMPLNELEGQTAVESWNKARELYGSR